jgi:FtsH Extracellular
MSYVDPKLKANRRIFVGVATVAALSLAAYFYAGLGMFLPRQKTSYVEISFSQLVNDVDAGRVHDILIRSKEIDGTYNDGHKFQTDVPADPALLQRLYDKGVLITKQP